MKYILIICLLLLGYTAQAQGVSEYQQIMNKFEQWKQTQYNRQVYAKPSQCRVEIVTSEKYDGPYTGIPREIQVSFTDINGDQRTDALITFSPQQCDGGNAMMNAEDRILILSKGNGYYTDDLFFNKVEQSISNGWIHVTSASYGQFYGAYYEYKEDDGRCCPSIRREFYIDYKTGKLSFLE